jgi:hypothetical protein
MIQSKAPRFAPRGGHLIALLAIASLVSGCVVAATAPGSSQPTPSATPDKTKLSASAVAPAEPASGAVVSWVDRPAPAYVEPTPQPYPSDARACGAKDLQASAGDVGAGLGNINLPVAFVNTSDSTCVLNGEPTTIDGRQADGTLVRLPITDGSYFGDPGPPANIAHGGIAGLNISGADACPAVLGGRHRVYPTLRIGLPGGGGVDTAAHDFDTVCGVSVSQFGVPADAEPAIDPPLSPLTAQISAPSTVVAGQILDYTVTLTNPLRIDVPLSPCPAYDEFVGSGSTEPWVATVLHYYLNCDASPTIPAGGSMTFAMRLALPADQPGGAAKFGWDVQGGGGPWANAALTVTAAGG